LLLNRYNSLFTHYTHVTSDMISREAMDVARQKCPTDNDASVVKRVTQVGGRKFLKRFLHKHGLKTHDRKKPIEIARAQKAQQLLLFKFTKHLHWEKKFLVGN